MASCRAGLTFAKFSNWKELERSSTEKGMLHLKTQ